MALKIERTGTVEAAAAATATAMKCIAENYLH
jgi:hypothetical protein